MKAFRGSHVARGPHVVDPCVGRFFLVKRYQIIILGRRSSTVFLSGYVKWENHENFCYLNDKINCNKWCNYYGSYLFHVIVLIRCAYSHHNSELLINYKNICDSRSCEVGLCYEIVKYVFLKRNLSIHIQNSSQLCDFWMTQKRVLIKMKKY